MEKANFPPDCKRENKLAKWNSQSIMDSSNSKNSEESKLFAGHFKIDWDCLNSSEVKNLKGMLPIIASTNGVNKKATKLERHGVIAQPSHNHHGIFGKATAIARRRRVEEYRRRKSRRRVKIDCARMESSRLIYQPSTQPPPWPPFLLVTNSSPDQSLSD